MTVSPARLLICVLLCAASATAQRRATLEGTVTIPSRVPSSEPSAELAGIVVAEGTEEPLAGATVTVSRAYKDVVAMLSDDDASANVQPVTTDENGRFAIRDLAAGSYRIGAAMPGFLSADLNRASANRHVVLASGERVSDLKIRLPRSSRIEGTLRDESGMPLGDTDVLLFTTATFGEPKAVTRTRSNADGTYRLEGFLAGEYIVQAGAPVAVNGDTVQSKTASVSIANSEARSLDLTLVRAAEYRISGAVQDTRTGMPPPKLNWGVSAMTSVGFSPMSADPLSRVLYNSDTGAFEISRLLPGIYQIFALTDPPGAVVCQVPFFVVEDYDITGIPLILGECLR